jgi:uncharacterized tellurite resistance protein B-like protein
MSDYSASDHATEPTPHAPRDPRTPAGRAPRATVPPRDAPPRDGAPRDAANPPPDVSLLLRAHAERRWLSREVIPVLRQIETSEGLPDEQLPAAIAYLEVIWSEALSRARETDAERRRLDEPSPLEQPLLTKAHHHHAAVRSLREAVARRVAQLLAVTPSSCVAARTVR